MESLQDCDMDDKEPCLYVPWIIVNSFSKDCYSQPSVIDRGEGVRRKCGGKKAQTSINIGFQ